MNDIKIIEVCLAGEIALTLAFVFMFVMLGLGI